MEHGDRSWYVCPCTEYIDVIEPPYQKNLQGSRKKPRAQTAFNGIVKVAPLMTSSCMVAWKMPIFLNVWCRTVVHSYSKKICMEVPNLSQKKPLSNVCMRT